ncbi:hypothetical protein MATL_G00122240 [Megalops atlanticus]|uniref:Uncharacterized protein n=1 Tax=Megalops atlanticus TaxID=7932 RepID=A0A9D3Q2U2_MEGAT|nr:hypothetical protein MATL_G00122240 [Megalops atlanticus]
MGFCSRCWPCREAGLAQPQTNWRHFEAGRRTRPAEGENDWPLFVKLGGGVRSVPGERLLYRGRERCWERGSYFFPAEKGK